MQNFRRKDAAAYKRKLFKDVSSLCIHPLATRIFLECFRSKRTLRKELLFPFHWFTLKHQSERDNTCLNCIDNI